jgi:hypothetical protein
MRKGICNIDGQTSKDSPKIFYFNDIINESDVENFDELVQKGVIKETVEPEVKTDENLEVEPEVEPEVKTKKSTK